MAAARLRKAFQHSDSDDEPAGGIDEEEQEKIINTFRFQDSRRIEFYTKVFVGIPSLATLYYVPRLLSGTAILTMLLAITSLLCTAGILVLSPARSSPSQAASRETAGPIEKYIVPMNATLCFIIALKAWSVSGGKRTSTQSPEDLVGYLIPLVMFFLILIARSQLKPVDVEGLDRLRYRYKGA